MKLNRRRARVIILNFMERLGRWIIDTWRIAKRHHRQVKCRAVFDEWLTAVPGSKAERKALDRFQALENRRHNQ